MDLRTYLESNSQTELARKLQVTLPTISQWKLALSDRHYRQVPAERCPEIERITNGLARCEDLRPDVAWDVLRASAPTPETTPTTEPAAAGGF